MSCKLKLFLPLIIVIAAFGAIINCYWLPNALDLEKQGWHLRQEVTAEILASNVPRLLLAANSPQLSATLDTILKKHREWRALTLRSPDGRILYRATSPPHPAAPEPNLLQLDLTENNKVIGTLSVELEQHALWQRTQRALQRFVFISMAFFLAVALLNHMLNEIWLWRPLAKLQHAAHHLAHGDYSATPPPSSPHAELGELTESFKLLCSNFQSREKQFQRQAALSETVRMIQAQFITDYPYTTELHSVLNTIIKLTTSEMGLIGELLARDQHGYNLK